MDFGRGSIRPVPAVLSPQSPRGLPGSPQRPWRGQGARWPEAGGARWEGILGWERVRERLDSPEASASRPAPLRPQHLAQRHEDRHRVLHQLKLPAPGGRSDRRTQAGLRRRRGVPGRGEGRGLRDHRGRLHGVLQGSPGPVPGLPGGPPPDHDGLRALPHGARLRGPRQRSPALRGRTPRGRAPAPAGRPWSPPARSRGGRTWTRDRSCQDQILPPVRESMWGFP